MRKHFLFFVPAVFFCLLGVCYGDLPQDKCAALFAAVKKDELGQVIKLLDQGVDVNCRGEYKYTPLILAAKYGRLEIAEALINRGADVTATADCDLNAKECGDTSLLWAVRNGYSAMIEMLLDKGASVGKQGNCGGEIPLILAARENHIDAVRILMDKGAAVDEVADEIDDTALITAVFWGHLEIADLLIERGADIKRRDQRGESLIFVAVGSGNYAEVRYFHEKGFSVDENADNGFTPIYYACSGKVGMQHVLEYLIGHGAKVNHRNKDGVTPLMWASDYGNDKAVRILIANGAVVRDADNEGETPLHHACWGIRDHYLEKVKNWEKTISLLLENGADVNAQTRNGSTPLMYAAGHNVPRIIELLIEHGASVDLRSKGGTTALMVAADSNCVDVIKALVKHGADLNIRDQAGETALTAAKKRGKHASRAAELLKSLGAKE